jgi:hypothetical protein
MVELNVAQCVVAVGHEMRVSTRGRTVCVGGDVLVDTCVNYRLTGAEKHTHNDYCMRKTKR